MRRFLTGLALALLGLPTLSQAAVLTFDDVVGGSTQNTYGALGTYQGFNFNCINCSTSRLDWIDTVGSSSWNFGAVSGDFTMLNNYGGIGVITAVGGADFTFDGMYAETWTNSAARTAYIRGFNNGVEIWTSTITLGSSFSYFGGVSGAIDELRLDLGNYFLVDNLALNNSQSVPEPTPLALLGLGLGALVMVRRFKQ